MTPARSAGDAVATSDGGFAQSRHEGQHVARVREAEHLRTTVRSVGVESYGGRSSARVERRSHARELEAAGQRLIALDFEVGFFGLLGLRGTGGHEARFNSENASTEAAGRGSPTTSVRNAPQTTETAAVM